MAAVLGSSYTHALCLPFENTTVETVHPAKNTCTMLAFRILENYNIHENSLVAVRAEVLPEQGGAGGWVKEGARGRGGNVGEGRVCDRRRGERGVRNLVKALETVVEM